MHGACWGKVNLSSVTQGRSLPRKQFMYNSKATVSSWTRLDFTLTMEIVGIADPLSPALPSPSHCAM